MKKSLKSSLVRSENTPARAIVLCALAMVLIAGGCASQQQPKKAAAFWPPYPDEPRVQYLVSFTQSTDVAPKKSSLDELVYGKEVEQVLAVKKPYGIKMYNGKIYVCD